MRMQAVFNGVVIAESDDTVVVEGNHYFPRQSLSDAHIAPSSTQTTCGWKGVASYYDVRAGDETSKDAVWYYPTPSSAAREIKDRVAFWKGVRVQPAPGHGSADGQPSLEAPEGATC